MHARCISKSLVINTAYGLPLVGDASFFRDFYGGKMGFSPSESPHEIGR